MEIKTFGQTAAPVPVVTQPTTDQPDPVPPTPVDPDVPDAAFNFSIKDLTATIDASTSKSVSAISQYKVQWGDGLSSTSKTPTNIQHTYSVPGSYMITLTVTNLVNHSDDASNTVTVTNPPPVNVSPTAKFVATKNGLQLTLVPTGSVDPDGTINNYNYSWGDGSSASSGTNAQVQHNYANGGQYEVILTVTDNQGATGSSKQVIQIDAPFVGVRKPSTLTPVKATTFRPDNSHNMQCFNYDWVNNQWFIDQNFPGSAGGTTPYESTNIERLSANGDYLDSMQCVDAGHGTSFVIEMAGNKPYIWLTWNKPALGSTVMYNIVRFPYTPGKFTRETIPNLQTLPQFTAPSKSYSADWEAGWLLERQNFTFRRRKISEYLQGVDKLYSPSINFANMVPTTTLQGYATINDNLFIYCGSQNGESTTPADPAIIYMLDWNTGAIVDQVNVNNYGKQSDGTYPAGTHEPEALAMVRDPRTHEASLYFGVVTGLYPNHGFLTWQFKNIGTPATL